MLAGIDDPRLRILRQAQSAGRASRAMPASPPPRRTGSPFSTPTTSWLPDHLAELDRVRSPLPPGRADRRPPTSRPMAAGAIPPAAPRARRAARRSTSSSCMARGRAGALVELGRGGSRARRRGRSAISRRGRLGQDMRLLDADRARHAGRGLDPEHRHLSAAPDRPLRFDGSLWRGRTLSGQPRDVSHRVAFLLDRYDSAPAALKPGIDRFIDRGFSLVPARFRARGRSRHDPGAAPALPAPASGRRPAAARRRAPPRSRRPLPLPAARRRSSRRFAGRSGGSAAKSIQRYILTLRNQKIYLSPS